MSSEGLSLYKEGLRSSEQHQTGNAIDAFLQAARAARRDRDWDLYVKVVSQLTNDTDNATQTALVLAGLANAMIVLDSIDRNDLEVAQFYYNAAYFYFDKAPYEIEAPSIFFNKALIIRLKSLGERNQLVAECYEGLGNVCRYLRYDYLEAERNYEHALEILEAIGKDDPFAQAKLYYNLATTNREQGDLEKALAYAGKAIQLVEKTGRLAFLERSYLMIANIYRDTRRTPEAIAYYEKGIELHKRTGEAPGILANLYSGLGQTYLQEGKFDEALNVISKSRQLFQGASDQLRIIVACQLAMDAYRAKGDDERFLVTSHELRDILLRSGLTRSRQSSEALERVGNYYLDRHHADSALFYFQQALIAGAASFNSPDPIVNPTLADIGTNVYLQNVLTSKARALNEKFLNTRDHKWLVSALDCISISERLLLVNRSALDVDVARWKFGASNYLVYERGLSIINDLSGVLPRDTIIRQAFYFFERSRSQSLTQSLANGRQARKLGVADSLLQLQENYRKMVHAIQDMISRETSSDAPNQFKIAWGQNEMTSLDRKMQLNRSVIESRYPGYFKVELDNSVPVLHEVQQFMDRDNATMIEYFWGVESVYGLAINGDEVVFRRLGNADSLGKPVIALIQHLGARRAHIDQEAFDTFRTSASLLHRKLIEPFGSALKGTRLRVSPDGPLSQIPMEVLVTEPNTDKMVRYDRLHYLVRDFDIGYQYSSALLQVPIGDRSRAKVLGMAYSGTTGSGIKSAIPGTDREIDALAEWFPGGVFLKGDQATKDNFKNLAPNFDILHLAIHGRGDPGQNYSASLFFRQSSDSTEDSELHAYELYDLKLNASMAVLSSCESGLGTEYKGEGMISMASAFTSAGCQNILMGLWNVPDQGNASLIMSFYQELREGKRIDLALSQSKRDYLASADGIRADPVMWAPIVSYGDQQPVFSNNRLNLVYVGGVGLLVLVFLFLTYRSRAHL